MASHTIDKIDLDSQSATEYIKERLNALNIVSPLERALLSCDLSTGSFYTYLPKNIVTLKSDVANKLDHGILGWQKELNTGSDYRSSDLFGKTIEDIIMTLENNCVMLIGDPYRIIKKTPQNTSLYKLDNINYYVLTNSSKESVQEIVRDIDYYPGALTVILDLPKELEPSQLIEAISKNSDSYLSFVVKLYLQAYDNEGYIVWDKSK